MDRNFNVGDRVQVDCLDGFGGPATVVAVRDSSSHRHQVEMDDRNPYHPFWVMDEELSPAPPVDPKAPYDSTLDTRIHIATVRYFLGKMISDLFRRQQEHDRSKLQDPEKPFFDEFTPKLAALTYGYDQYKSYLTAMKPALDHHYAHNPHHPEHFAEGIRGMDLLDVLEMLCDWAAAVRRHEDGDLRRSIEINQNRFGYSDELKTILLNTLSVLEAE